MDIGTYKMNDLLNKPLKIFEYCDMEMEKKSSRMFRNTGIQIFLR